MKIYLNRYSAYIQPKLVKVFSSLIKVSFLSNDIITSIKDGNIVDKKFSIHSTFLILFLLSLTTFFNMVITISFFCTTSCIMFFN